MKYVVTGFVSIVLVVAVIVTCFTIQNRNVREAEMDSSLSAAVDAVVEQMSMQGKYTVHNQDELVADFMSLLVEQLNVSGIEEQTMEDGTHIAKADADENFALTVDVAGVDAKKGLLSVHITEEYTHPNGKVGKLETTATIVLEQEEGKPIYEISYHIPDDLRKQALELEQPLPSVYKRYIQEEGETLCAPENPPSIGNRSFIAWADADGARYTGEQLKAMKVDKALSLNAIYN